MLRPDELDALVNRMTVDLLEATSSHEALARANREERELVPAYDACPMTGEHRYLLPREIVLTCPAPNCGHRFVWKARRPKRIYCCSNCAARDWHAKRVAA